MPEYCNKAELAEAVRRSHEAGGPVPELWSMASDIFAGMARRLGIRADDDVRQDWAVWLVRHWSRLRPEDNSFGFMSTSAKNVLLHSVRKKPKLILGLDLTAISDRTHRKR